MFCGEAGYPSLTLTGVPEEAWESLNGACRALIETSPNFGQKQEIKDIFSDEVKTVDAEIDIAVWVYDRSFNPQEFPLGLKFNENWAEDQRDLGYGPVYDGFHPQRVPTDWRLSNEVPPLAVTPQDFTEEGVDEFEMAKEVILEGVEDPSDPDVTRFIAGLRARAGARRSWADSKLIVLRASDVKDVIEGNDEATFFIIADGTRRLIYRDGKLVDVTDKPLLPAAPVDPNLDASNSENLPP